MFPPFGLIFLRALIHYCEFVQLNPCLIQGPFSFFLTPSRTLKESFHTYLGKVGLELVRSHNPDLQGAQFLVCLCFLFQLHPHFMFGPIRSRTSKATGIEHSMFQKVVCEGPKLQETRFKFRTSRRNGTRKHVVTPNLEWDRFQCLFLQYSRVYQIQTGLVFFKLQNGPLYRRDGRSGNRNCQELVDPSPSFLSFFFIETITE